MSDAFIRHPHERALYEPLVGKTMLELGNKRQPEGTYKDYFTALGYAHTSVDWNGQDGALKVDLRRPLELGTFDMVSNIGTTEHVDKQEPVWRNICEAMAVGSVLVSTTPKPGHWPRHGFWYPTEEFYPALADLNGMEIERFFETPEEYNNLADNMFFCRMRKVELVPFSMPVGMMFDNR